MLKFILKRLLQAIPLLLIISFLVFFLIHVAPFDYVDSLMNPNMTPEMIAHIRERHGLDQPFLVQYFFWLRNILTGDFGTSMASNLPIAQELASRIPNTMRLIIPSYITALIIAIGLGLLAGANKNKKIDTIIDSLCSVTISVPTYFFAMLCIYFLGFRLGLFPIMGMQTIGQAPNFIDQLRHFFMPYITLVFAFFPTLTRYIRMSTINQTKQDYVTVQQAFHATKKEIYVNHILRNILIPIVTLIGSALPMLVTGAVITETIFAWPGVGPFLINATRSMDFPVIMAVMLLSASLVIIGNLLADILYFLVDPRIARGGMN